LLPENNRNKIMKILFVSDLNDYSRGLQRFRNLKELGHEVVGVETVPIPWRLRQDFNFWEALSWKFRRPADLAGTNKKMIAAVKNRTFDIIWIEKGNVVKPKTLNIVKRILPAALLVSCSEDDMYGLHNRSLFYDRGLRLYDIVFTTKVYNLLELKILGARQTELFLDAYDEHLHKPMILSQDDRIKFGCEVGFVGSFEEDRAQQMLFLAENGVKISVWGLDWDQWVGRHANLSVNNKHLYSEDYSKAINAAKINLCFLRKLNRDEVTSRSVEIPACGGFMIAERTKRHLEFFEEDREAVFFSSREELLAKINFFLDDGPARQQIADAGR